VESFEITAIQEGNREKRSTAVSEEVPLTIELNGSELATLLCSPGHLKNLVTGFLFTTGLLGDLSAQKALIVDRDRWKASVTLEGEGLDKAMVFKRIYTSGCGKGVIFHNPMDLMQRQRIETDIQVSSTDLSTLMKSFQKQSEEHQSTRGVHSGALAVPGEILIFRDDIGRHNAIDKVIGESLYQGIGFSEKILLTSGRISSEILSKALRCRMPLIVAVGAPTNQAVKLAREVHLTLVGLVKGNRMIVYSGEERIR
jgi:FdhD protein